MTKKVVTFFRKKLGDTITPTAPGDTNRSDATVWQTQTVQKKTLGSN